MTTDNEAQARVVADLRAAANKTLAEQRQEAGANRQPAPARGYVLFPMMEAARVSGMGYMTLRHWIRRGWLKPVRGTIGHGYKFSAWQVVGLSLIAAMHNNVRKNERSYLDRSIIRSLANLADQDDALLLSTEVQDRRDMSIAERAAAIASAAISGDGMTPEMMNNLTRALAAIDAKASRYGPVDMW
jgi:hypothetical protein